MTNRKGTSLVETLVMLAPFALILGAALMLLVRSAVHDAFNDTKLASLDAALIANERLQHDIACAQADRITTDQGSLSLGGRVVYAHANRTLTRNGRPVRAAQLKDARFERDGALLALSFKTADLTVRASAHLIEPQAHDQFASWSAPE